MSAVSVGAALHPPGDGNTRPCATARQHSLVDETYVKVADIVDTTLCWAINERRPRDRPPRLCTPRHRSRRGRFFRRLLAVHEEPEEVTTDRAPALAAAIAGRLCCVGGAARLCG